VVEKVQRCHALLMPSGTYHEPDRKHLFIVCTDKCKEGNHILVSITGWTNHLCDDTTRLKAGDHPFLYKDSYVFYRKARIESSTLLQSGIESGDFELHDTLISDEWVKKIMEGICSSIHTPRKVKKYANCPPAGTQG
jgi:hypothetical protein